MDQFANDPTNPHPLDDASQRHGARDSLLLSARFRVNGVTSQVRVRNLSSGGLMAEHPEPVRIHTPVEIEVRGIGWVSGRIAWCTDGRLGIAFDREIDPMLARKPVGTGRKTAGHLKPILPRR